MDWIRKLAKTITAGDSSGPHSLKSIRQVKVISVQAGNPQKAVVRIGTETEYTETTVAVLWPYVANGGDVAWLHVMDDGIAMLVGATIRG
jgi:hypothetical protein